jgi:serine/threonine-protein kinase RsbT
MQVAGSTRTSPEERSTVADELRVEILSAADVVQVRQRGREFAASAGFTSGDQTVIAVAISEIARNIVSYAKRGAMTLQLVTNGERQGVRIVAEDRGPGIGDITRALQDGFSTSGGLGVGLPGARRLMDEFDIRSATGEGTTVTMTKWRRHSG